jgi:hypothetical protein
MGEIHRDDVPFEVVESIEKQLGKKVRFVGDLPPEQVPQHVRDLIAGVEAASRESFVKGVCIHCGAKVPDWPPSWILDRAPMPEKWELPDGWRLFLNFRGEPGPFQCGSCEPNDLEVDP